MRKPLHDISIFSERRKKLADNMKGAALIIPSHPHFIRNNDNHYPFRQDSNLFYLTGFEESHSLLVFRPGQKPECTLFVQPKDPTRETWDGFLYGPDAAKNAFGMDACFTNTQITTELPKLLKDVDKVYYTHYINREMDDKLAGILKDFTEARSRTNLGNLTVEDPRVAIGELRIRKSDFEIQQMRKAAAISSEAHKAVMKACRPGVNERTLQGVFIKEIMERGCAREGYGSILAGGVNATTLHYTFNDQELKDGDMFLIDAGGEYNYYTADITRGYPVNGKFTADQKRVYQKVLDIQKNLVAAVKPGQTREGLQKMTIESLTEVMIDEGLLRGKKADLIENKDYLKYYMHGVSHWLGIDVHDAGATAKNGEPRPIEPGFCLTIEPGLYIPIDDEKAPKALRGFGLRIEDDILVTASGQENLTQACPKEVDELEAIIGR